MYSGQKETRRSQFLLCAMWILRIELCLYLLRHFMNPFHLDKVLPYTPAAGEYGLPTLASHVLSLGVCQYSARIAFLLLLLYEALEMASGLAHTRDQSTVWQHPSPSFRNAI